MDPLTKSYPWYTPYQFAGNTPIAAIDLDGLEEFIVTFKRTKTDALITVITYVKPNERAVDCNNPELGKGGIEYVNEDGTVSRLPDFKAGSSEAVYMSTPITIINQKGDQEVVKKRDAGGALVKKEGDRSTYFYGGRLITRTVANFDNESGELKVETEKLEAAISSLQRVPESKAIVIGYTDKDPMLPYINTTDPDGNLRLSQERADAVKKAITNNGISSDRVSSTGVGSVQADQSKKNPEDRKVTVTNYRDN